MKKIKTQQQLSEGLGLGEQKQIPETKAGKPVERKPAKAVKARKPAKPKKEKVETRAQPKETIFGYLIKKPRKARKK